jgi:hypothetical protein
MSIINYEWGRRCGGRPKIVEGGQLRKAGYCKHVHAKETRHAKFAHAQKKHEQ